MGVLGGDDAEDDGDEDELWLWLWLSIRFEVVGDFRVSVKWPGSLPSFRIISGSSRRLAFMNQLHTWWIVRFARFDKCAFSLSVG